MVVSSFFVTDNGLSVKGVRCVDDAVSWPLNSQSHLTHRTNDTTRSRNDKMNSSNLVYRVRHEQQPHSDLLLKTSYSSSPTPSPAASSRQQQQHWQIEKRRRRRRSPGSKVSPSCLNVLVVSALMAFMTAWLYLSTTRRTQPSVRNMRNIPDKHSSIVLLERLERDGSIPPAPPVRSGTPNFGNLQLSFPSVRRSVGGHVDAVIGPEVRQILHDTLSSHLEDARTKNETGKNDDALKTYYAFDDDYLRDPYRLWDDDQIKEKRTCRRVSWHRFVVVSFCTERRVHVGMAMTRAVMLETTRDGQSSNLYYNRRYFSLSCVFACLCHTGPCT
jgi:hypothetical protein